MAEESVLANEICCRALKGSVQSESITNKEYFLRIIEKKLFSSVNKSKCSDNRSPYCIVVKRIIMGEINWLQFMDNQTILAYDDTAEQVAALHKMLVPARIYWLIDRFFIKGEPCADVGCGIGRDSAWLSEHGYRVIGIDASEGMLQQASQLYPNNFFVQDSLPLLEKQSDSSYMNVLCSAVIMHLVDDQIAIAITNLMRITALGGVIIISFRGTSSKDLRENGKLYSVIDSGRLIALFVQSGAELLHHEVDFQEGRGVEWTNIVFRKLPALVV